MMDYSNTQQSHRKAMMLAQDAYVSLMKGDESIALQLYKEAYSLERDAALSLLSDKSKEPTRSVLFRSAATIALKCKKYEEAKRMVAFGLAGNPPEEIAIELRDLESEIDSIKSQLEIKQTKIYFEVLSHLTSNRKKYPKSSENDLKKIKNVYNIENTNLTNKNYHIKIISRNVYQTN